MQKKMNPNGKYYEEEYGTRILNLNQFCTVDNK